MPPFLKQAARYIYESYGTRLPEIAVILPNRRAGLFLRKHLAGMLSKTSWSPAVMSVEEFLATISGLREADQITCLFALFRIHREVEKEKAQPFDEFLHWAAQLLSDFNEVDRYLVDPARLFSYLDEVRAMTVWNPDNAPLTDFQQNYLKFYQSLYTYYNRLTSYLLSGGEAYQGLLFRQAWRRMEQGEAEIPWKKVLFTGFNALTTSEEKIMDLLVKKGIGEFLWDADSYYVDEPKQEAGDSLRQWFRQWPGQSQRWISDDFRTGEKEIRIIGAPDLIGQVKLTGNLLEDWQKESALTEWTAVILPDEKLLLPLLNSMPQGIGAVNITMGLPLIQTPLAEILLLVYDMHLHAIRMTSGKKQSGRFYFRDVVKVLQHTMISRMASERTEGNQFTFRELIEQVKTGQKTFLRRSDMIMENSGLFGVNLDFLDGIFGIWDSLDGALKSLQGFVQDIVDSTAKGNLKRQEQEDASGAVFELECAYAIARILRQLSLVVTESAGFLTWDSLAAFLKQLMETTMLPFYGEPLKGLQVMGMLETRTLDFDRVVILSCNEGILPSGKSVQSFIPFDVRRNFNLPLTFHKDAVYAYHFYRLLQHSSQVWLLYNTEPGKMGGGDPSRFIRQIEAELPAINPSISIRHEVLVTEMRNEKREEAIRIIKTDDILRILKKKAVSGFAPTSLNLYRSCSLKFYLSEVAGIKELEGEEDEIDPRTLGSAVHRVLMNLYKPFLKTNLSSGHLAEMESRIDKTVDEAFRHLFKGDTVDTGKNLLLVEASRIMIRRYIRREKQVIETLAQHGNMLTVEMIEQPLHRMLLIPTGESETEVRLKGFLDRVDRAAGVLRVIDYKTGNVGAKDLTISDWDLLKSDPAMDKGFQLLTYAWLLLGDHPARTCQAGIVSLKKQASGFIPVTFPGGDGKSSPAIIGGDISLIVKEVLTGILTEMFNPALDFSQTADEARCSSCPYRSICGR